MQQLSDAGFDYCNYSSRGLVTVWNYFDKNNKYIRIAISGFQHRNLDPDYKPKTFEENWPWVVEQLRQGKNVISTHFQELSFFPS